MISQNRLRAYKFRYIPYLTASNVRRLPLVRDMTIFIRIFGSFRNNKNILEVRLTNFCCGCSEGL
jgi:hypothetical protein